jgi:hypothetical protein
VISSAPANAAAVGSRNPAVSPSQVAATHRRSRSRLPCGGPLGAGRSVGGAMPVLTLTGLRLPAAPGPGREARCYGTDDSPHGGRPLSSRSTPPVREDHHGGVPADPHPGELADVGLHSLGVARFSGVEPSRTATLAPPAPDHPHFLR